MDRALILEQLRQTAERIAEVEQRITEQRALIDRLSCHGYETTEATALLRLYEQTHAAFVADRIRLREELEQAT